MGTERIVGVKALCQWVAGGPWEPVDVVGEPVGEHLAVTPHIDRYDRLSGWWTVTHLPTGRTVDGSSVCIAHARLIATCLAGLDVDWATDDLEAIRASAPMAAAHRRAQLIATDCAAGDSCPCPQIDQAPGYLQALQVVPEGARS